MTETASSLVSTTYHLVRAEDQVDLRVQLVELTVAPDDSGGHQLEPGAAGGYLMVTLPAQHVLEPTPTREFKGDVPAFSQPTRVVFRVDKTTDPIPFTVDGVLAALPTLNLVVDGQVADVLPLPAPATGQPAAALLAGSPAPAERAVPDATGTADRAASEPTGTAGRAVSEAMAPVVAERQRRAGARLRIEEPTIADPTAGKTTEADAQFGTVTSLRLPSRLELTPRGGATVFSNAGPPVTRNGRTELWHTRLAILRQDERVVEVPSDLIVLDSHELPTNGPDDWMIRVGDDRLGRTLDESVRQKLVDPEDNNPLTADQLMLSALGAWLDVERDSDEVSFRHRMAMGRDQVVRTVLRGRLYPFGHQATMISTTERRFDPDNGQLAVLTSQSRITVRKPVHTFNGSNEAERGLPWHTVRLLTRTTPGGTKKPFAAGASMLHVGGAPFRFRCLGVDRGGRVATFELPLVFVEDGKSVDPTVLEYPKLPIEDRRITLSGQTISVAPPSAEAPEATDVVADSLLLKFVKDATSGNQPRPTSAGITGKLPSLQKFVPALANTPLALNIAGAYLKHGFGQNNTGQLVLQLAGDQAAPLLDLADKAVTGGLTSPSFSMNAVSRLVGPVGGGNLATLATTGKVSVADLLKQTVGDVKLLGVFSLVDLIGGGLELELAPTNPARRVPQLVTEAIDGVSRPRLHWEVDLFTGPVTDVPASDPEANIGPVSGRLSTIAGSTAKLIIDVTTEVTGPVDAPQVHTTTTCRVEHVKLTMGAFGKDLVAVPFRHLEFTSKDGRKPEFDAGLGEIEFFGVLAFVRTLAALVPQDGFYDPPALDVTDEKITSSFAVPIPAVSVGMFSLENITFSTALDLWYAKPPELSLNFATFENRFRLSVLCLGGGGYVGLALSTRGLQRLDGALEFGASLSVNLGVARGAVSVMGGVHFAYDAELGPQLSGYLEVRGEVEVLCLLEVGVSLLVVLTYHVNTGELSGKAQLEVRVKALFFSKTVRVPFEYTFIGASQGDEQRALTGAGSAGIPGFLAQMAPADWPSGKHRPWDSYCLAFA